MTRRSILRLIWIVVAITIVVLYVLFDPSQYGVFPKCYFYHLTGLQCPGCGLQRMFHALLHGDILAAWHYNAYLLCSLPFIGFMIWVEIMRTKRPTLYARVYSMPTAWIIIVMTLAWFVLRNILSI